MGTCFAKPRLGDHYLVHPVFPTRVDVRARVRARARARPRSRVRVQASAPPNSDHVRMTLDAVVECLKDERRRGSIEDLACKQGPRAEVELATAPLTTTASLTPMDGHSHICRRNIVG